MGQYYLDISSGTKIKHEMWNAGFLNQRLDKFFEDDMGRADAEMVSDGISRVEIQKPRAKELIKFLEKELKNFKSKEPKMLGSTWLGKKLGDKESARAQIKEFREQIKEFIVELNKAFKGTQNLAIQWEFN